MGTHVEQLMDWAYESLTSGKCDRARICAIALGAAFAGKEGIKVVALCSHALGKRENAREEYAVALAAFPNDVRLRAGYRLFCQSQVQAA